VTYWVPQAPHPHSGRQQREQPAARPFDQTAYSAYGELPSPMLALDVNLVPPQSLRNGESLIQFDSHPNAHTPALVQGV
jgi:hypothetical protein